jgi:hypothetical protein
LNHRCVQRQEPHGGRALRHYYELGFHFMAVLATQPSGILPWPSINKTEATNHSGLNAEACGRRTGSNGQPDAKNEPL